MSHTGGANLFSLTNDTSLFVNITVVAKMIEKHIFWPNNNSFDVFIHSWNYGLREWIIETFQPRAAVFSPFAYFEDSLGEVGSKYGIPPAEPSRFYSMRESLNLVKQAEFANGRPYERVVVFRPDVILFVDMNMTNHSAMEVYNNCGNEGNADFHFVMNSTVAAIFAQMYEHLEDIKVPIQEQHAMFSHKPIHRTYLRLHAGLEMLEDEICAHPRTEEVFRKLVGDPIAVEMLRKDSGFETW